MYLKGSNRQALTNSINRYLTDKDMNLRDDKADREIKILDKRINLAKVHSKEHNNIVAKEKSKNHDYSKKTVKERGI